MRSYQMPLSDKQRKTGRFVYDAQRELLNAFVDEKKSRGLTQQEIADKLGVEKSVINRRLNGQANLTLRVFAEMAWAMDRTFNLSIPRELPDEVEIPVPARPDQWCQLKEEGTHARPEAAEIEHALTVGLFNASREYAQNDNINSTRQLLRAA